MRTFASSSGFCPLCKVAEHTVSQCPVYLTGGTKGRKLVSCIACQGKGHMVGDCLTLENWVLRASAVGRIVDFRRVTAPNSKYCFACLQDGIGHKDKSCPYGEWREGWLTYRAENRNRQRHNEVGNAWTDLTVSKDTRQVLDVRQRPFGNPMDVTFPPTALEAALAPPTAETDGTRASVRGPSASGVPSRFVFRGPGGTKSLLPTAGENFFPLSFLEGLKEKFKDNWPAYYYVGQKKYLFYVDVDGTPHLDPVPRD